MFAQDIMQLFISYIFGSGFASLDITLHLTGGLPSSRAGDCSPRLIQASREEFLKQLVVSFHQAQSGIRRLLPKNLVCDHIYYIPESTGVCFVPMTCRRP